MNHVWKLTRTGKQVTIQWKNLVFLMNHMIKETAWQNIQVIEAVEAKMGQGSGSSLVQIRSLTMVLGAVPINRCHLTSIGIPMLKTRRSHDHLIFNIGISIPGKDGLYIETVPKLPRSHGTIIWTKVVMLQLNHREHTSVRFWYTQFI